jgi:hypothetical protein
MSAGDRGGVRSRGGVLAIGVPLLLYLAFAALVYWAQGSEPELNLDHIAYLKMANTIRAAHPDGAYWRDFDSLRGYSILIAYGEDWYGSPIVTLKLLLAAMTVAYLIAFQGLATYFTGSRPLAVACSLLSALFVSFGASFWGMTDFAASLNRTLVVPFFVLIIWFFLRHRDSGWRYATYSVLIVLSLLHLSTFYLLLVLWAYEGLEFLFLRRARFDRRLLHFAAGFLAAVATRWLLEKTGLSVSRFVEDTFQRAWGDGRMSAPEAWAIELYAFPWRNLPPPLTTLANLALSYGVILALSVAGAIAVRRRQGWSSLDRVMLTFAGAVVVAAYGIQTLIWVTRSFAPIYPINFEEVRAINFLMIPSVYFVARLVGVLLRERERDPRRLALVAAIAAAVALQPIVVLRALPVGWREALITRLTSAGVLHPEDTLRMLYARQYLGLANEGPRFYYAARGILEWLDRNARPGDRVLTDRNEVGLAGLPVVGAFQTVAQYTVTNPARHEWKEEVDAVRAALESRDIDQVRRVAKKWNATLVIVPWPEPDALYRDQYFSILRVT